MSQCSRFPSDVKTNAPLRVPTSTRTPLIPHSFPSFGVSSAIDRSVNVIIAPPHAAALGHLVFRTPAAHPPPLPGLRRELRDRPIGQRHHRSSACRGIGSSRLPNPSRQRPIDQIL